MVLVVLTACALIWTVWPATSPQLPDGAAFSPSLPSTTTSAPAPSSAPASTDPSEPAATSSPTSVEAAPPLSLTVTSAAGLPILSTASFGVDIGAYDPSLNGDGTAYLPIDLEEGNWLQPVWVRYQPLVEPSSSSSGTTYIVGHACNYHVCPFSNLYQASVGDTITVTTSSGTITYQISAVTTIPKDGGGQFVAGSVTDPTIPNRIVLETCSYETDGASIDNLMVAADLVTATPVG